MPENLKTNYEQIKEHLEAAQKAYQRFTEILENPIIIADRDAKESKGKHLLGIIETGYHSHLPVELLQLVLLINLPGAGNFETRSTNLWIGAKHFEGIDVAPVLKSMNEQANQWEMALNAKVTDEGLNKLVANVRYYSNQIQNILGEVIVLFHIA